MMSPADRSATDEAPISAAAEPDALGYALAALGVHCRVEGRDRLALVVAADVRPLVDSATRRRVAALAAAHGYTHVAVELDLPPDQREAFRRP